ncbi:MAG TPA: hypothetical protein VFS20_18635, partial [Longimicrobium sp.]|nr:hypothetical protein [Longimicrobium sp.]
MRRFIPLLLALATALSAVPAHAQDTIPPALRRLPAEQARRVVAFFNDPGTVHLSGDSRVAQGTAIRGNVAALDGELTIAGRV